MNSTKKKSIKNKIKHYLLLSAWCSDMLGTSLTVLTLWVEFGVVEEESLEMSGCGEELPVTAG